MLLEVSVPNSDAIISILCLATEYVTLLQRKASLYSIVLCNNEEYLDTTSVLRMGGWSGELSEELVT